MYPRRRHWNSRYREMCRSNRYVPIFLTSCFRLKYHKPAEEIIVEAARVAIATFRSKSRFVSKLFYQTPWPMTSYFPHLDIPELDLDVDTDWDLSYLWCRGVVEMSSQRHGGSLFLAKKVSSGGLRKGEIVGLSACLPLGWEHS